MRIFEEKLKERIKHREDNIEAMRKLCKQAGISFSEFPALENEVNLLSELCWIYNIKERE